MVLRNIDSVDVALDIKLLKVPLTKTPTIRAKNGLLNNLLSENNEDATFPVASWNPMPMRSREMTKK